MAHTQTASSNPRIVLFFIVIFLALSMPSLVAVQCTPVRHVFFERRNEIASGRSPVGAVFEKSLWQFQRYGFHLNLSGGDSTDQARTFTGDFQDCGRT